MYAKIRHMSAAEHEGCVAVVSGAGYGIGRAVARDLYRIGGIRSNVVCPRGVELEGVHGGPCIEGDLFLTTEADAVHVPAIPGLR